MKRRTFLLLTLLSVFTKSFATGKKSNELTIIKDVFFHLFPTTSKFNGADKFNAFEFFIFISRHPTFDKEDLDFLIRGAKKLQQLEPNFLTLNQKKKEFTLREFEKTTFGYNWLVTLLNYGFEAMLGDPIYRGNKNMLGWKDINHATPIPTAKKPFGELS